MHLQRRFNLLRGVTNHFQHTLGAGILVILPIGVTILIFKFFFDLLDPLLQPVLQKWIPGLGFPGLGLAVLLVLVYLVGLITAHVAGRRVVALGHKIVEAIPMVKSIYSVVRSAVQLLSTHKDQPYSGVVLIDYPSPGMKTIALVTAQLGPQDGEEMLAVYVPTPPSTYSGLLAMVAAKDVTPTEMSTDDALKIIISGGVLAKDFYKPPASPLAS
jgi:uncharacterized membrane protein